MRYIPIIILAIIMQACSFEYIPPAHKGKILTANGYKADILPPSKKVLWGRDELVLIQTSTQTYKESMTMLMADKLTLKFDVRFRARIDGDDDVINSMFNDIIPASQADTKIVTLNQVYSTYGQMLVRNKARELISKYGIDDVHKNYSELSGQLYKVLKEAVKGTPLELSDVVMADIAYPKVVTDAVEAAKERQVAIDREKQQMQVELIQKEKEQKIAQAQRRIEQIKARTIAEQNKIVGNSISDKLLKWRQLDVLEAMSNNKSAVFIPYDAMQSTGANIRMFSEKQR